MFKELRFGSQPFGQHMTRFNFNISEIIHKETKKKTYNKRGNYKKQVFCRFPPD